MGLEKFKNKYKGERAFLVGNGPSLKNTPLEELDSEYTFATNKINKIYTTTNWRPTFYSYTRTPPPSDDLYRCCIENTNLGIACFISHDNREYFDKKDNIFYFTRKIIRESRKKVLKTGDIYQFKDKLRDKWSDKITYKIYQYNCSMYPIYQLVNYMGFDEIYLIGCDLGIDKDGYMIFDGASDPLTYLCSLYESWSPEIRPNTNPLLYDLTTFLLETNQPVKSLTNTISFMLWYLLWKKSYEGNELAQHIAKNLYSHPDSHFNNNYDGIFLGYYQKGEDNCHRRAHELARRHLKDRNVEVYNATLGGELEVFPRVRLEDVI